MPRGRPVKCPYAGCGSTDTVSKGVRVTKTLGIRKIRRCRSCGRRFTPKHQKSNPVQPSEGDESELVGQAEAENVQSVEPGIEASVDSDEPADPAIAPPAEREEPSDEHPRYGL